MPPRAEFALQQLYEDPGLRDELTDDEASLLLKWGEVQTTRLDAHQTDDADFEAAIDGLRRLLESLNRFIGRRTYSTPDEQAALLDQIAEHASALGYAIPPERRAAFLASQADLENFTALSSLLALIDGSSERASTDDTLSSGNAMLTSAETDSDHDSTQESADDSHAETWLL